MSRSFFTPIRPALLAASAIALASATAVAKNWDDWSAPANIESLPGSSTALNTPAVDGCVGNSPDGLKIAFTSNRAGTFDIYMATRSSTSEGFGPPVKLPPPVNTDTYSEACPTFGPGNRLYFVSTRDDEDAGDILVSKHGPNGWSEPQNLGPNINTPGWLDESPAFFDDEDGRSVMVFSSRNDTDGIIYQSVEGGPKSVVPGGPNSSASDNRPSITRDGLTIFFDSDRTGGLGGPDIYYAMRSNTSEPFGPAIHLIGLSSPDFDARPNISKSGAFVTFSSNRAGSTSPAPDIWFATREKITGN